MQPIAGALTSTAGYQTLQHFITHARWNEQEVWKQLRRAVPAGPGVYLIDDTGFPKQGRHSVGVSRQYSGTLGRVGSCQVGVGAVFAQKRRVWPMGLDLYLPREWAENLPRRESVEIPHSVEFLEKWRISLSQLDRARRDGILIDAVVADAGYGEIFEFRQSLRKRQLRYLLAVHDTTSVRRQGREGGAAISLKRMAKSLPRTAWKTIKWRDGTKGPLRARFAAVRVRAAHGWTKGGHWPTLEWLVCERSLTPGERNRYYLSNLPQQTPLRRLAGLAHERWKIEEHFKRLKEEIGIDHFEGRSWIGWHHHTTLAAVAFALTEAERLRGGGRKTFEQVRGVVRRLILLMMLAEKNEDAMLLMSFKKRAPPGWGFG